MPNYYYVSIHAPAWGATFIDLKLKSKYMFQSTRPRGARRCLIVVSFQLSCFNPRARVGRDNWMLASRRQRERVSIHAPAWGATVDAFYSIISISLFLLFALSYIPRGIFYQDRTKTSISGTNLLTLTCQCFYVCFD